MITSSRLPRRRPLRAAAPPPVRLPLLLLLLLVACSARRPGDAASAVDFGCGRIANHGLVAVGRIPAAQRDRFGETFGSCSGLAVKRWRRVGGRYEGTLVALPDRGFTPGGTVTVDYADRVNFLEVTLTPGGGGGGGRGTLDARLGGTLKLTDGEGRPLSGLDPARVRKASGGFPMLPKTSAGRVAVDPEALALMPDGTFFVGDEYGPYVYRFSARGKLISAVRPPDAFVPVRKGEVNFSSNNPPAGGAPPVPPDPVTGRQNNQGFEGVTLTPDGEHLVAVLQSATRQDGGDAPGTRRFTRALVYDIRKPKRPKLRAEYVVPLPLFQNATGSTLVAAQSEVLAIGNNRFLMLSRDTGNGFGVGGATSRYRAVDLAVPRHFDELMPVAPKGVLDPIVKPAKLTPFININDNSELAKFGLHNGEPNDVTNLSEKWESLALASALDPDRPDDYFLFVGNDNDFLTTDGFQVGVPYNAGVDVPTTILVYRLTIPKSVSGGCLAQKRSD
ncbi:MAG: esterase-like activity of phytase-domain-containing protein [Olpidium bornovanus]|uniref:Esterase-like activity of phytase-domain-containing protein n=1 Tax=Olpidium bornovanus TaxID=278681 RepID=A0A8H8DIN2_9FUNG|nr:MAG: esterase-like activity of phytase-domain-containing protein [Olpidium bornovanus]